MPFKSRKQLRKFASMAADWKISDDTFNRWVKETRNINKLPERLKKKK